MFVTPPAHHASSALLVRSHDAAVIALSARESRKERHCISEVEGWRTQARCTSNARHQPVNEHKALMFAIGMYAATGALITRYLRLCPFECVGLKVWSRHTAHGECPIATCGIAPLSAIMSPAAAIRYLIAAAPEAHRQQRTETAR